MPGTVLDAIDNSLIVAIVQLVYSKYHDGKSQSRIEALG